MKALVTGATGFIGSSLVRVLLQAGYEVRALVRVNSDTRNIDGLPLELVIGDLLDAESLRRAIQGCQQVFHVAALYSFWVKPAKLIYDINVEGTRNVLLAAAEAGVDRVVYTSSVATLGLRKDRKPADEETPVDPRDIISDYKKSKYLAERVALEFARKGLPVVIVNPSFPVGVRDLKPTPTGQVILSFLNGRMPAYMDTGVNIVDVENVALGHLLAAQKGKVGERYILGGENVTMEEMLKMLEKISGRKAPRIRLPYRPVLFLSYLNAAICQITGTIPRMTPETIRLASRYMFYDPRKAIRELGLPQTSAYEALRKAVAWFQENGYVKT